MKTFTPKPEHIERRWYVVDADGVVLGRLATHVASVLRGKHKPIFAPHVDTGDHVVVVNASKVRLTGAKLENKQYYRHSGYPGGLTASATSVSCRPVRSSPSRRRSRGCSPRTGWGARWARSSWCIGAASTARPRRSRRPSAWARCLAGRGCPLPKPKPKPRFERAETGSAKKRAAKKAPAKKAPAKKAAGRKPAAKKAAAKKSPAKRAAKKES